MAQDVAWLDHFYDFIQNTPEMRVRRLRAAIEGLPRYAVLRPFRSAAAVHAVEIGPPPYGHHPLQQAIDAEEVQWVRWSDIYEVLNGKR